MHVKMQSIFSGRNETSQIAVKNRMRRPQRRCLEEWSQRPKLKGPAALSAGDSRLRWSYPEEGASVVMQFPTFRVPLLLLHLSGVISRLPR